MAGAEPTTPSSQPLSAALEALDTNTPNAARIYDAWLGGKDNFRADRRAADEVAQAAPFVVESARTNRAFLRRAVMHPPSTLHLPQGWPWQPAWNGLHTAESVRERIFTRKR